MIPAIFRLVSREMTNWGDYGYILQHGMASRWSRRDGKLQLERTGPFVPPISFPSSELIVDHKTKVAIEEARDPHFRTVTFRPVIKSTIVNLDWQDWDLAGRPRFYPPGGEPELYLEGQPHDRLLALQMPDLWEVALSPGARERRTAEIVEDPEEIRLHSDSWQGGHWFCSETSLYVYVTEVARRWIEPRLGEWVRFEPVEWV